MTQTLDEKMAGLSPERRQKVQAMAKQLMAEETMIRDLRLATAPGSCQTWNPSNERILISQLGRLKPRGKHE